MDFTAASNTLFSMAKTAETRLYLGQWMARLGMRSIDLARETRLSESYISNLINGKVKKNPSTDVSLRISRALGITVNDLFSPPPGPEMIAAISDLQPDTVQRLIVTGRKQIHKPPNT